MDTPTLEATFITRVVSPPSSIKPFSKVEAPVVTFWVKSNWLVNRIAWVTSRAYGI
jgi:hypothetical protein